MKSKSFDLKRSAPEKAKQNKTFDFTSYYKSAAETKIAVEGTKPAGENINKENKFSKSKNGTPSRPERTPNKKKNKLEPLDISRIDIEGPGLDTSVAKNSPLNDSKMTSTPQTSAKGEPKVKSIMKNKSLTSTEDYMDSSSYTTSKPKKRNKSVSFMLEDNEEVVVKKTKSNESSTKKPESPKATYKEMIKAKKMKKAKEDVSGKENKRTVNGEMVSETKTKKPEKNVIKVDKTAEITDTLTDVPDKSKEEKGMNKKSKVKKFKKQNSEESMEVASESNNNEDQTENKNRKAKKKKHSAKAQANSETSEGEGEPAAKSQKKESKPEAIVENLESLSIGDNAHTLTNLLDEMTVVDKDKKKKNKQKGKKDKKPTTSASSSETADLEKIDEGKEKIKWKKRKWNKGKKGDTDDDTASTSVVVDNLPLSMVVNYKKQLGDQFGKYGQIKKIGVAEVYPTEESKPVFTTTIQFTEEAAAIEAIKEDSSEVFGQTISVRRALPATQTTLVVRSYGELTDQTVSSAFAAAGRIRSIRHLVKGKKAIATAFVEFDGPAALQRALALGAAARAGGKRLHAAAFDPRRPRKRAVQPALTTQTADSEDTNSE